MTAGWAADEAPTGGGARLFLAATRKSSGKTMVVIGLCAAFVQRGVTVQPFKKGPDFIDPMWLTRAAGCTCRNLDYYMMGREQVARRFAWHARQADLSLIEGNMGLFDGQEPDGSDCGAALAAQLEAPVILVVNVQGMARGVAPLVCGHRDFPGGERIQGVLLNNVASPRQEGKMRAALEQHTDLPVLGALPRDGSVIIDERHLGLIPVGEQEALALRVSLIRDHVARHTDLDRLLALARTAPPLAPAPEFPWPEPLNAVPVDAPLRIGYAADAAFHFYYPENLEALRRLGVTLIPFSLLHDTVLPDVAGLFIGGGFPEIFMEYLSSNESMRWEVRKAAEEGMPIYAECGGLMYLAESLRWQGKTLSMAGALPMDVVMESKPQGYGYMSLEGSGLLSWPPSGRRIHCHEFHYSRVARLDGSPQFAYRVTRGRGIDGHSDGLLHRHVLASYAHIHADGAPEWAPFLVEFWRRGGPIT